MLAAAGRPDSSAASRFLVLQSVSSQSYLCLCGAGIECVSRQTVSARSVLSVGSAVRVSGTLRMETVSSISLS